MDNSSMDISKGSEEGVVSNIVPGFLDYKGEPANKLNNGGIRATIYIFVMTALEHMAHLGTSVNLMNYFYFHMHYSLPESADLVTNFMGVSFLLSIIGAFITDTFLSKLNILLGFGCIEFIGFMLLTIQAQVKSLQPTQCDMFGPEGDNCKHVRGGKSVILFSGLYLVALGSGGLKATLPTLGADQFDENDPKEQRLVSSFFNYFLFSLCVGACVGVLFLVWLQNNEGWDISLSISSSSILLGLFLMTLGYTKFRNRIPTGSPATNILHVIVAAIRNRKLDLPTNHEDLYEEKEVQNNNNNKKVDDHQNLSHTAQFRFLDKAAIRPVTNTDRDESLDGVTSGWKLCTVTRVEEVKVLLRMVPIFASTIIMNTCLAQLQTFSIQQGVTMDKKLGSLEIPAASIPIIPMAFIVILTPVYDRVFVPLARRFTGLETGISHLCRVGIGLVLSILSMVVAAIVEGKRKNVAEENDLVYANPMLSPLPMSIFMLAFQYFIFGIADLFTFVGLLEFFYSQAPRGLKSLGTALAWCSMSLGYFQSSLLINLINRATKNSTKSKGWLNGNNLNVNHLDLFYWTLAILSFLNFLNYLYWANWYTYKGEDPEQISQ